MDIRKLALAAFLKKNSLQDHSDWEHNWYFERDFNKVYPDRDPKKLTIKEKLKLINKWEEKRVGFKNMPDLETRRALQKFGDYLKHKHDSELVLARKLIKKAKELQADIVVVPDVRFILEACFLKNNWFHLIKLKHPKLEEYNRKNQKHLSEQEMNLNEHLKFSHNIDMMWCETVWEYYSRKDEIKILRKKPSFFVEELEDIFKKISNPNNTTTINIDRITKEYKKLNSKNIKKYQKNIAGLVKNYNL